MSQAASAASATVEGDTHAPAPLDGETTYLLFGMVFIFVIGLVAFLYHRK